MTMQTLHDVLVDSLKDLYHAEKQLVKALPRMAKAASSDELRAAFEEHLEVTEGQVERLEKIFEAMDLPARTKVCKAMAGLIEENKELLEQKKEADPAALDAAMVAGAQKVEHYEIASYGSARAFAETLGLDDVVELLQETLDEESEANEKLTALAEGSINQAAAEDAEEEEEEQHERRPVAAGGRRRK